jgi:iron complex transport system permease protein
MIVGAALAASGVLFQGLLRNPLADPYILGTSGGAALGMLAAYFLSRLLPHHAVFSTFSYYFCIFLGAFGATVSSYLIARTERSVTVVNLLLAGVIVSTFCGALVFLFFSLQNTESFSMFFFLMGSLMEGGWSRIAVSAALILAGLLLGLLFTQDLNILSLGEEKARSLGIEVERLKFLLFGIASLLVAAAVAVSGPIGFVGLVVPHVARLVVGPNNRVLLPTSVLLGATLLVLTDMLARTVASPIEIPVGVLTAMLGTPFFLWLLRRKRRERYF